MKVLVVGAGYVGGTLVTELTRAGHAAWGVRRSPADGEQRMLSADATSADNLRRLDDDFEQIVMCISPDERSDGAYERAYPRACRSIAQRFPNARLLLISSTAVYGQSDGEVIRDESEAASDAFNAVRIRQAENVVLDHGNHSVVVRASGIYGPGRVRTLSLLAHTNLDEQVASVVTNRIHRDDLVGVLRFLLERPETNGVFLATDPHPSTFGEIQSWVREQPGAASLPVVSSRPRARKSRKMIPQRLLDEGYRFVHESFREGYKKTLSDLSSDAGRPRNPK